MAPRLPPWGEHLALCGFTLNRSLSLIKASTFMAGIIYLSSSPQEVWLADGNVVGRSEPSGPLLEVSAYKGSPKYD